MLVLRQIRGGSFFLGREIKIRILRINEDGSAEVGFDVPKGMLVSRADIGFGRHLRRQIQREWKQRVHAFEGTTGNDCALCGEPRGRHKRDR